MHQATEGGAYKTCQENVESKLLSCNVQGTIFAIFQFYHQTQHSKRHVPQQWQKYR